LILSFLVSPQAKREGFLCLEMPRRASDPILSWSGPFDGMDDGAAFGNSGSHFFSFL
jgi:hypothetical protein